MIPTGEVCYAFAGVQVFAPSVAIEQAAKAMLTSRVEFDLDLPVFLVVVPKGQTLEVPIVEISYQIDAFGPDRARGFSS